MSFEDNPSIYRELIIKLAENEKVVILIDEYDKPIIDYFDDLKKAEENRGILKNFYSILKDADHYIRFLFITGVSKFSKVSIFSDLNNLTDITLDKNYAQMIGWTQEEVEKYFDGYIEKVGERYKDIYPDIMSEIKKMYNGYSWDGVNFVYNPVSLMNLFSQQDFRNYWFETGTPTFLTKFIKNENYTVYDIENNDIKSDVLEKYDLQNITLLPLLFQTGYLTIKKYDLRRRVYTLDYPNKEVAEAMSVHILAELTIGKLDKTGLLLFDIIRSFEEKEIEEFIEHINTLFESIPYPIVDKNEKYFHSLFYIVMRLIGFTINAEILTIRGRVDAVVETDNDIFIIEFKVNQNAKTAIQQIREKKYAEKYKTDKRPVILLGINFSPENKRIDDFLVEGYVN